MRFVSFIYVKQKACFPIFNSWKFIPHMNSTVEAYRLRAAWKHIKLDADVFLKAIFHFKKRSRFKGYLLL